MDFLHYVKLSGPTCQLHVRIPDETERRGGGASTNEPNPSGAGRTARERRGAVANSALQTCLYKPPDFSGWVSLQKACTAVTAPATIAEQSRLRERQSSGTSEVGLV